jgi:hypothetical protein
MAIKECFACEKLYEAESYTDYCSVECQQLFEAELLAEIKISEENGLANTESIAKLDENTARAIIGQFNLKVKI